MEKVARQKITVETTVNSPVEKVWELWIRPFHIMHWNFASIDWHTPYAESDFRVGGKFISRMEELSGKSGFDFAGEFTNIELYKVIEYILEDGRKVRSSFEIRGLKTRVAVIFDAENINPPDRQQEGWQAILDNFKRYAESYKNDSLHFEKELKCSPEKVYTILTEDKAFREWTSVFDPTSHFVGSWSKRSKIRFVGTDSAGKKAGLVSRIKENIPNKFISIEHNGIIKDGYEVLCGPQVDDWSGALEIYTLTRYKDNTLLHIDLDNIPDMAEEMKILWPKALAKIIEICERDNA